VLQRASYGLPRFGHDRFNDVLERCYAVYFLPQSCHYWFVSIQGLVAILTITQNHSAMEKAGAAAIHIEDQVQQKPCGVFDPNKSHCSQDEMVDRVKPVLMHVLMTTLFIMARYRCIALKAWKSAIRTRHRLCSDAGADMIFQKARLLWNNTKSPVAAVKVPLSWANITGMGATPLVDKEGTRHGPVWILGCVVTCFELPSCHEQSRHLTSITFIKRRSSADVVDTIANRVNERLYES